MSHIPSVTERNGRRYKVFRTLLLTLVIFPTGCKEEKQANETPAQPPAATQSATPVAAVPVSAVPAQPLPVAATPKPLNDLESLVAPIALYPDPLLAELLVASTYPLEVVQAQRWLETKPDLATLNSKDWDASVMRLTTVRTVIKMMNDHLDWTTQLGDTFLAKPVEVMDSIQALRKRAKDAGFLKDTSEQKVSTQTVSLDQPAETDAVKAVPAVMKKEVISIAPAKADTIYVPQYNPETVYQAPLAAPVAASPGAYYPTYYPAPATSTTSSTDSMLTFGAGALVGGLLTWGIMEWADDDDDWDDHYHVNHYYGDSVCHNGNCWHGGGGYGDRGNVNVNNDVNISGNEINIDKGGRFNQNNLRPSQQPAGWRPNPKHRRGQAYPEAVQKRLGASQQPALAGHRLGAAQTLPAAKRGFAEAGQLPAERRPSSADIREQLAQKPGAKEKPGIKTPANTDLFRDKPGFDRDNALQGLKNSGKTSRLDSQRGANSRQAIKRENQPIKMPNEGAAKISPTKNLKPKSAERVQEQKAFQRRSEVARPSAFEKPRTTGGAAKDFSQRGAASVKRSEGGGNNQKVRGGGNKPRAAGGGGGGKRGGAAGGLRR